MRCLAPAVSPDFRDSSLGAHPLHIDVDGRKGLPALPSSSHSVLGVWGGRPGLVTSQAPSPPQPVSSPGLGSSCLPPTAAHEGVDLRQQVCRGEAHGPLPLVAVSAERCVCAGMPRVP